MAKDSAKQTEQEGASAPSFPPILFSPADSFHTFVEEIRGAPVRDGHMASFEAVFPVSLVRGVIDGSPAAAGGCVLVVDEAFIDGLRSMPDQSRGVPSVVYRKVVDVDKGELEPVADAVRRFCAHIRNRSNYGIRFAFLTDKEADRLLNQMRVQAAKETEVQNEAMVTQATYGGLNSEGVPLSAVLKAERAAAAKATAGIGQGTPTS